MANIQDRILRYRIIEKHIQLVREGDLQTAWGLLYLLRHGKINFGLFPYSAKTESILDKLGCKAYYSRNYSIATLYLRANGNIIKEEN